jgi:ribosomal protein L44E
MIVKNSFICFFFFAVLRSLLLMLNNERKELQQKGDRSGQEPSAQRASPLKSLSVKNFCTICANTHLQRGEQSARLKERDFNENGTVIN